MNKKKKDFRERVSVTSPSYNAIFPLLFPQLKRTVFNERFN